MPINPQFNGKNFKSPTDNQSIVFPSSPNEQGGTAQVPAHKNNPLANWLMDKLSAAQSYKNTYSNQWERWRAMYESKQWYDNKINTREDWRSRIVVNYTMAIIESIQAVLLDSRPKTSYSATNPNQYPMTHTLQCASDSIWRRRNILGTLGQIEKSTLIYGNGIGKCFWNEKKENGQGDVDFCNVPPEYFYIDPSCMSVDEAEERGFILEVHPRPMSYVKEGWPEKAHLIRSDTTGPPTPGEGSNSLRPGDSLISLKWVTPIGDNPLIADQTEYSSPSFKPAYPREDWVNLTEAFFVDNTMETREVWFNHMNPNTGQWAPILQTIEVPKYPYGRHVFMACGEILSDEPWDTRFWPYVTNVDIDRPDCFWGIGEPELLEKLQKELNLRRSQMVDHAALMGNAIWIVDKSSMVDPDMITNKPGAIVEVMPGTQIRRESPPPLPPWMHQMVELTIRDMREISGVSGIPGGQPPKGVRSGAGFEAAQAIASIRIRARGRTIEAMMERLGRIMISLIQTRYTTSRMIRITGEKGATYFVPFNGQSVRGDWDIKVESASTQNQTKAARDQQLLELFRMNAIDRRALLEGIGFPGWEEVLKRAGDPTIVSPNQYPGYPGNPLRDTTDSSGYSASIRTQVPQPPPPPQGGEGGGPGGPKHAGPPKGK